jgi:hypothetical protein
MRCQACQSTQVGLRAEIAIHFPGRENLNTPHVFVFPNIVICLDCGSTNFTVPEAELQSIRERFLSAPGDMLLRNQGSEPPSIQ